MNFSLDELKEFPKPIDRLIKVCSRALGRLTNSYFIRKESDAIAQKIKTIGTEVIDSAKCGLNVVYKDENTEIKPTEALLDHKYRVVSRLKHQQQLEQDNIESILNNTFEELLNASESECSDSDLDDDWITKFFKDAANISTEHMQKLWGKILAGEIISPGSYSMRTIDFIRNTSKDEAVLLDRVSQFAIRYNSRVLIPKGVDLIKYDLNYEDILKLQNLGLIYSAENLHTTITPKNPGEPWKILFKHGDSDLLIKMPQTESSFIIEGYIYTPIGCELYSLLEIRQNMGLCESLARQLKTTPEKILIRHPIKDPVIPENPGLKYIEQEI